MANIDRHCHLALIDSGCELSLAPSTIVGDGVLRPVSQGVFAANGSPILVQGETEIEMSRLEQTSRSVANRRKTRLKFHGVAVFVRSQEADIYSKIATRHTINDKYSNSFLFWSF